MIIFSCSEEDTTRSQVGTKYFKAPEILLGDKYRKECDVWSVGVVFLQFITNEELKLGPIALVEKLENLIVDGKFSKIFECIRGKMTIYEKNQRASVEELTNHEIFKHQYGKVKTKAEMKKNKPENNQLKETAKNLQPVQDQTTSFSKQVS